MALRAGSFVLTHHVLIATSASVPASFILRGFYASPLNGH